jgi:hypothetical protein
MRRHKVDQLIDTRHVPPRATRGRALFMRLMWAQTSGVRLPRKGG